jgi:hypothetical protein
MYVRIFPSSKLFMNNFLKIECSSNVLLENIFIHMYAKCGNMEILVCG